MPLKDLMASAMLLNGLGAEVSMQQAVEGKKALALYFSAHWCPPCRGFTPKLAEWYKSDLAAKGLEVVFVSSDRDEDSFKGYFAEQPWLALPFEDRATKEKLSRKFKVQGIPSLVILDPDGKTITTDGRAAVSQDPTGTEFPWRPVPLKDLMASATLLNGVGAEVSMQQAVEGKKALALYFSAHWCPPCRGFTPKLAEWYKSDLAAKGLEVVFVSSDRDEDSFKGYFAEQPWLALKYEDRKLKEKLDAALKVEGIPTLVILDADLNVVNTDGRSAVTSDPEGAELPWHPKPVKDLKDGPGDINEVPTLLVLCETSEQEEQRRMQQELEPLACKYIEKQKATDDDLEIAFMIGTSAEGITTRIRELLSLPAVNGAKLPPRMALLDIPDNGGYYLAEEGAPVSAAAAEQLLADYRAGKLDRKQLS